jgi:hypothetical protein
MRIFDDVVIYLLKYLIIFEEEKNTFVTLNEVKHLLYSVQIDE